MEKFIKKADVLIEALPYIRRFRGKVVVLKYGGSALNNELKPTTIEDIIFMHFAGIKVVVVHGGGPFINQALIKAGKKSNFIDGLRVTDKEVLDVVEDVLINKVNKEIVEMIRHSGANAKGLTDKEASLIKARQIREDLGFVGEVTEVSPVLADILKNEDCIYVLAPLARGNKQLLNINADHFAGEIASSIPAEKIIFMTDVSGIMRDQEDPSTLIPTFKKEDIEEFIKGGVIGKGMIPKVRAGEAALDKGVSKVHIIDGRIKHALLLEVFTDKGIGTEIIK